MRRATASAVALAVLLALAGCAEAGVDGDLTDDWPALGEPRPFLPVAGVCHPAESPREVSAAQSSVDCAVPHLGETVHVGAFPAGVAKLPPEQAAESRAAFAECDRRAAGYVGAQWRSARLRLDVAVPTGTAWARGARWFRCDLTEVTGVEQESPAPVLRTGSLRNALTTGGPLLLGCYTAALSRVGLVEKLTPVDCARGHNAEFAGVWPVPERLDRPTPGPRLAALLRGMFAHHRRLRRRSGRRVAAGAGRDQAGAHVGGALAGRGPRRPLLFLAASAAGAEFAAGWRPGRAAGARPLTASRASAGRRTRGCRRSHGPPPDAGVPRQARLTVHMRLPTVELPSLPGLLAAPAPGWVENTDVIVVGSGVAGLTAALQLREAGLHVTVVTKVNIDDGSTRWAQGGIAAVLDPLDTPQAHARDTEIAGVGLCDPAGGTGAGGGGAGPGAGADPPRGGVRPPPRRLLDADPGGWPPRRPDRARRRGRHRRGGAARAARRRTAGPVDPARGARAGAGPAAGPR